MYRQRTKLPLALVWLGLMAGTGLLGGPSWAQRLYDREAQDQPVFLSPTAAPPPVRGRPRLVGKLVPEANPLPSPPEVPLEALLPSPSPTPTPEEEVTPSPSPTPTPKPDYLKTAEEIALEPIEETEQRGLRTLITVFQVQPRLVFPVGVDLQGLPPLFGGAVDWNFLPTGLEFFTGKMAVEMSVLYGRGQVSGSDVFGNPANLPVWMFDAGVGLNYYFLAESLFQPFVGLSVSYFTINFDSGGRQLTTVSTPLHLRAGVDVMPFSNGGITLEVAYLYSPLRLINFNPADPSRSQPLDFPAAGPGPSLAGFTVGLAGKITF